MDLIDSSRNGWLYKPGDTEMLRVLLISSAQSIRRLTFDDVMRHPLVSYAVDPLRSNPASRDALWCSVLKPHI